MSQNPILGFFNQFVSVKGFDDIQEIVARKAKNRGFTDAVFQSMMRSVGWTTGQAWCAYYVKLVYMQFFSFDREWVNKNFTGSAVGNFIQVRNLNKQGDRRYITITTDTPQVTDIPVWGIVGRGHTGIVTQVINPNRVETVEGNTNLSGAREGDGAQRLTRNVRVGQRNSEGQILNGYIRRNFTEDEIKRLYFDEEEQTLKFKTEIVNPVSPVRPDMLPKENLFSVFENILNIKK
jgi:hypothetical protein